MKKILLLSISVCLFCISCNNASDKIKETEKMKTAIFGWAGGRAGFPFPTLLRKSRPPASGTHPIRCAAKIDHQRSRNHNDIFHMSRVMPKTD